MKDTEVQGDDHVAIYDLYGSSQRLVFPDLLRIHSGGMGYEERAPRPASRLNVDRHSLLPHVNSISLHRPAMKSAIHRNSDGKSAGIPCIVVSVP